jgi:hypothetical protein
MEFFSLEKITVTFLTLIIILDLFVSDIEPCSQKNFKFSNSNSKIYSKKKSLDTDVFDAFGD